MGSQSVDVIIPTYNSMPYLREAVNSVLSQDYKNIKVLIIDDGSTDGTEEYVTGIADSRVSYFSKVNGGPSSARNYGVLKSSSEYIAFLDGDDMWYSHKISSQMKVIQSNRNIGLVCGNMHMIDSQNVVIGVAPSHKLRGNIFKEMLKSNQITGGASMVLVRRKALLEVGPFRDDIPGIEDWEMWIRICRKYMVDFVPDYLVKIRYIQGSGSVSQNMKRMMHAYKSLPLIVNESIKLNTVETKLIKASCSLKLAQLYLTDLKFSAARRALLQYFSLEPSSILAMSRWNMYIKILFSSQILRRVVLKIRYIFKRRST